MATASEKHDIDRLAQMDKAELKSIYHALEKQGAYDLAHEISLLISAKVANGIDEGKINLHDRTALKDILTMHGY